ncbi:tripartite tricarboxylate transporter TctB family protein [Rhodovulum sulfidophilum]|uniref:tripartite tricarboxylate transporter TctB family protein n=1 Tax=Rhodovulum sulfidophilum TaxID=35806 RepID=UPI001924CFB0|nr:tripartite tricarboxylate transporter TctB family protein [Rhodovulum sulfidophilum]MBL3562489.1 tripartite tricarboxylate transporter TctB family protein [Rhodovulum sulfidophilum]
MLAADRLIALALMGFSVIVMWYARRLPVGWEAETGPGAGAFPFWLGLGMLLASGAILARSFVTRPHSGETFIPDADAIPQVLGVVGLLLGAVALIPLLGAYIALMLFLLAYLRLMGGHGWLLTGILTLTTPVFLFFFFEVTLKILLPKGVTEPLFYPLYAMFF